MCGICGVIGGERGVAETRVARMMAAMVHRGPDEDGVLAEPFAVLGMRRLSIIDLGGGPQPVYNEDGTVGVVFNGEIYNFEHLRSMFAFALWDGRGSSRAHGGNSRPRVLLARDRLGIKPLYYATAPD